MIRGPVVKCVSNIVNSEGLNPIASISLWKKDCRAKIGIKMYDENT